MAIPHLRVFPEKVNQFTFFVDIIGYLVISQQLFRFLSGSLGGLPW
jgi:hypothetical protein